MTWKFTFRGHYLSFSFLVCLRAVGRASKEGGLCAEGQPPFLVLGSPCPVLLPRDAELGVGA